MPNIFGLQAALSFNSCVLTQWSCQFVTLRLKGYVSCMRSLLTECTSHSCYHWVPSPAPSTAFSILLLCRCASCLSLSHTDRSFQLHSGLCSFVASNLAYSIDELPPPASVHPQIKLQKRSTNHTHSSSCTCCMTSTAQSSSIPLELSLSELLSQPETDRDRPIRTNLNIMGQSASGTGLTRLSGRFNI